MAESAARPQVLQAPPQTATAYRPHRILVWCGVLAAIAVALAAAFRFAGGEVLRDWAERTVNRELHGYRVRLPALRIDVLGLGLDLVDLTVSQTAHPQPPVALVHNLNLSVNWSALLHGRVVAKLAIDRPRLHIDRGQLAAEATDAADVENKGWQDAVQALYPLDVNQLILRDGSITYVDSAESKPLVIDDLSIRAANIRNVATPNEKYPSPVWLDAVVFDSGHVHIEGDADFLARPYAAADVAVSVDDLALANLDKLSDLVQVRVRDGVLSATGHVEYGPKKKNVYLRRVRIDGVKVDYVDTPATSVAEKRREELAAETAATLSDEAATRVYLDLVEVRGSELAYRKIGDDGFRVFVSDADVTVRNILNREADKPSTLEASGRFMGRGSLALDGRYRPGRETPDFSIGLRIEQTPLPALNDVFLSYGNFDVSGGSFALYSELTARDGRLDGYMKPLFKDMDIYHRPGDAKDSVIEQAYEGVVGGAATILHNSRDDVAAKVDISGRLDDPNVSALQTVISLIGNAFVRAIAPGFEHPPGKRG